MSAPGRVPLPNRDPLLDVARLRDESYFAATLARYQLAPAKWSWYLLEHSHTCPRCLKKTITHTGLEATRDGPAAHECCGRDVRVPL